MKKVDMIVDLQFGSTGKGLIAGYLAETRGYDVVINANMPNAGHTYINAEGRKWMHKVLPNGIVSPNLKKVMIGPGSIFSIEQLISEVMDSDDLLSSVDIEVLIHPNAVVLKEHHKNDEQDCPDKKGIGSTRQGSAEAMIHKIHRSVDEDVIARDDTVLHNALNALTRETGVDIRVCAHHEWRWVLHTAKNILAEAAQGYSLGLNSQFYPYCTSRDCTPARFLSDMGIPHKFLRHVVGTMRVHPIRVAGTSGGCYPDQHEISWEELGQIPELTTVTKKVRRVFTYSQVQVQDAIFDCQPDEVFVNFCNYDETKGQQCVEHVNRIANTFETPLFKIYKGHGPTFTDVEEYFNGNVSA